MFVKLVAYLADKGLHVKWVSKKSGLAWETVAQVKHEIPDEVKVGTLRRIAEAVPGLELIVGFREVKD